MSTITWLHLSDLHFGCRQDYDHNIVLDTLLEDVEERAREDGLCPDFAIVTGDVAFSGQPQEYGMAREFLDRLLAVMGLGRDRLFLVPGNHDVDRKAISPLAAGATAILHNRRAVNDFLGSTDDRILVLQRLRTYREFLNGYLAPHLHFNDARYYYVKQIDVAGCRLALLGLNSAWLARGGEKDRHRLLLGERQVRDALNKAAGADLRLALMHHPFDWLHDFDRQDAEALLCRDCDFVLHGHMHQLGLLQARTPDSEAMIVAAGACYETREYPNSYNLIRLELDSGQGEVHLRMYSDRGGGFWTKDVLNYRNVPEGVYHFRLSGRDVAITPPAKPQQAPIASPGQLVQADGGSAAASRGGAAVVGDGNITITGQVQGGVSIVQEATPPPGPAPGLTTGGGAGDSPRSTLPASGPSAQATLLYALEGHTNWVWDLAFSPDGKILASVSTDRTLRLWDVETGQEQYTLSTKSGESMLSVAFQHNGRMVAAGGNCSRVILWRVTSGRLVQFLGEYNALSGSPIYPVTFGPGGSLVTAVVGGRLTTWDAASGEVQARREEAVGHPVAFHPDLRSFARWRSSGVVEIWDLESFELRRVMGGEPEELDCLAFSADGRLLAGGSVDHVVQVWEVETGRELHWLDGHEGEVRDVSFSPDGRLLASGSRDKTVRLWDVASGREIQRLEMEAKIEAVAFSPGGRFLAAGDGEKLGSATYNKISLWAVG